MNIGKITELCEKYIIVIDTNQNNLLENINELSNPKFSISTPNPITPSASAPPIRAGSRWKRFSPSPLRT